MVNRIRPHDTISSTPWRHLLTSLPIWSCAACSIAYLYTFFFVAQYAPTYFSEVLHLDVRSNGFLSGLPFIAHVVGQLTAGPLSDCVLQEHPSISLKLFNTVAMLGVSGSAFGFTMLKIKDDSYHIVAALFCGIMFFASLTTVGYQKSPLLIAAQHTGVIGAMINFFGLSSAIVLPYLVSSKTTFY